MSSAVNKGCYISPKSSKGQATKYGQSQLKDCESDFDSFGFLFPPNDFHITFAQFTSPNMLFLLVATVLAESLKVKI